MSNARLHIVVVALFFLNIFHLYYRDSLSANVAPVPYPDDVLIRKRALTTGANYSAVYDEAWANLYASGSCYGCRFYGKLQDLIDFQTVLDAGAGNGMGVRMFRALGKFAYGVELSGQVLEHDAKDLLDQGWVQQGSLTMVPFEDESFDLVVSSDVLEHIKSGMEEDVVRELVRVLKRYIVLSISLKSHKNEDLHTYLRSRTFWENLFSSHGAVHNPVLKNILQDSMRNVFPVIHDRDLHDCREEGHEQEGGKYRCCLVRSPWLVGLGVLRQHRAVTPDDGDFEPWMFAFEKVSTETVKNRVH